MRFCPECGSKRIEEEVRQSYTSKSYVTETVYAIKCLDCGSKFLITEDRGEE